jgi:hypothetical protein
MNTIEKFLSALSRWQVILLVLALGFVAGTLFGDIMGTIHTEDRIGKQIAQVAMQDINLLSSNNSVYEITLVNGTCHYTGEDSYACEITNTRTGVVTTKWIQK